MNRFVTRVLHYRRENNQQRPLSKAIRLICLVVFCFANLGFVEPGRAELSFCLTPEDFSWSDYKPDRPESVAPVINLSGKWQYQAGKKTGTISVPSCYAGYNGIVSFSRDFTVPEEWRGKTLHLKFFGIQHRAAFYLNGAILGTRDRSNAPFEVSVPERLINFGESNTLVVEVDNRKLSKVSLPLKSSVFAPRNYGGITREVFLLALPPERIGGYSIEEVTREEREPERQSAALLELNLSILLGKDTGPADIMVEILKPGGDVIGRHRITLTGENEDEQIEETVRLPLSQPRRWRPDDPYLYRLHISLSRGKKLLDRIDHTFALRPVQNGDSGLLDSYNLSSLRGVTRVEQWPQSGVSPSLRQLQEEIQLIRQLGVDFVHCAYFPPHPYFINMCDSLGLLLFVEIPLFGVPTRLLSLPSVQSAVLSSMHDLQDLAREHPSIAAIGWGSKLEASVLSPEGILNDWVQSLDSDLPCYVHTIADEYGKAGIHILKPHSLKGSLSPNLIEEISVSIGPLMGEKAAAEQALSLKRQLGLLPDENGSFIINSLNDWYGDKPLLFNPPGRELYRHTTGLTFASRRPRDAYYVLQRYDKKAVRDSGEDTEMPLWEPPWQFLAVGLVFTALGLWIMRVDNLFRQNLRRAMLHSAGFFSDIRDRRFLQGSSTLFLMMLLAAGIGNMIATLLYTGRFSVGLSALVGHLIGSNPIMVLIHSAAWFPARGSLIAGLSILCALLVLALLIRLGSPRPPRNLTLRQSIHIIFWSGIPALILLPLSAFYLRLDDIPLIQWFILSAMVIALIWFYMRLIFSVAVGYRSGPLRPLMVLMGLPALFLTGYITSLQLARQSLYYLSYIADLF